MDRLYGLFVCYVGSSRDSSRYQYLHTFVAFCWKFQEIIWKLEIPVWWVSGSLTLWIILHLLRIFKSFSVNSHINVRICIFVQYLCHFRLGDASLNFSPRRLIALPMPGIWTLFSHDSQASETECVWTVRRHYLNVSNILFRLILRACNVVSDVIVEQVWAWNSAATLAQITPVSSIHAEWIDKISSFFVYHLS